MKLRAWVVVPTVSIENVSLKIESWVSSTNILIFIPNLTAAYS